MRTHVLTAAAAALTVGLGLASPAFAQDKAPFTGAHAEALVGYDNVGLSVPGGGSDSRGGLAYGGAIGYDAQIGGIVLGAEGEIMGATTHVRENDLLTAGDRLRVGAGRDLYAGARLGYVVSPRTMLYAKAGYTNARINARYTDGSTTFEDHQNAGGYRVGAGAEYKIGPTTFVKAEYRYSHYSDVAGYNANINRHQVLGGMGVRF